MAAEPNIARVTSEFLAALRKPQTAMTMRNVLAKLGVEITLKHTIATLQMFRAESYVDEVADPSGELGWHLWYLTPKGIDAAGQ